MKIRSRDKTMYEADESSRKALFNNTKLSFFFMYVGINILISRKGQYFNLV